MFNFMEKKVFKTFQIRDIHAKVWKAFKIKCTQQDKTLNQGLIDLVTKYTKGKAID